MLLPARSFVIRSCLAHDERSGTRETKRPMSIGDEFAKAPGGSNTPGSSARGSVTEYAEWLASSLSSYEALAKTLVAHRAEKGRIVESVVKSALRSVLPGRFSLGTGFAITASGQYSSQLDLVIYDGLFNSPIILEGGTGLFPIECIYGFIGIKSILDRAAIDDSTKAIGTVRGLANEKRYVAYGVHDKGDGRKVVGEFETTDTLPPRSFVFAINSAYADIETVEANLRESTEKNGAHIHGLAVMDKDWFFQQVAFTNPNQFRRIEGQSLAAFCAAVLDSIQSITILPASMKRYLGLRR
jgi:hypothetical protein